MFGTPLALILALPPWNLWPLALVALVPFFLLIQGPAVSTKKIFWVGTGAGALYWAVLYHMFFVNVPYPWLQIAPWIIWMVAILVFVLLALVVGLTWGLYAWAARRLIARAPRGLLFWLAALWVIFELIRSFLHWQVTWGMSLGYSLPPTTLLGSVASLGGIWLVALVLVLINWQLSTGLNTSPRKKPGFGGQKFTGLILTLVVWLAAGWGLETWLGRSLYSGETITAVALQTSQTTSSLALDSFRYDQLLHQVNSLAPETPTSERVIVMPEVAYAVDPSSMQKMTSRPSQMVYPDLSTLAAATIQKIAPQTTLVAGFVDSSDDSAWQNGALVASRDIQPVFTYKRLLFPFGEYLPLEKIWPQQVRQFYRYQNPANNELASTAFGPLSVLFCNEVFAPNAVARDVAVGAKLLTVLSSNFDVGTPWYAVWQQRAAAYRALETWRPLILATDQARAAVIDQTGTIRAEVALRTDGVAEAEIIVIDQKSPWVHAQPVWQVLVVIIFLVLVWLLLSPSKKD